MVGDKAKKQINVGEKANIFLTKTNFYSEKGGQVGDTGWLIKDGKIVIGDKDEWRKYMGMPSREGWIWKILSVGKLTLFFYSLAIIVLVVMIICI